MAGTSTNPGLGPQCLSREELLSLLRGESLDDLESHLGRCQICRERLQALAEDGLNIPANVPSRSPETGALQRAIDELKTSPFTSSTNPKDSLPNPKQGDLPKTLGSYQIRHRLAEGGMGVILEAHDPLLNRDVAIKLIKADQLRGKSARERILREARAVAAIEHEAVVPVFAAEISDDGESIFIVMPLVSGGTLQDRLDQETPPLPNDELISIGSQIARGLAAAHEKGILHRDIKPANILMRSDNKVWLADFGIATSLEDLETKSGSHVSGTPAFMSPEQIKGSRCDARSDLFSLGTVLYQMATGKSAFNRSTSPLTTQAIVEEPHEPSSNLNPNLPGWLSNLIDQLLQKKPADRPQNAQEIAHQFGRHLQGHFPPSIKRRVLSIALIGIFLTMVAWLIFRPAHPDHAPTASLPAWTSQNFINESAREGYATLSEAIDRASPGDTIEIQINGIAQSEPLDSIDKALIIRAADGFEPTLTSNNSLKPILQNSAPLILEGLRIRLQSRSNSSAPLILARGPFSAAHCSFGRDTMPLRPGARPLTGVITTAGAREVNLINCAIATVASNAFTLDSEVEEVNLTNVLIATPVGIHLKPPFSGKLQIHMHRSSFHGKGLAAWDPNRSRPAQPVIFKLSRSAIETTKGVFGIPARGLNAIKMALDFRGSENLYSPGTNFLLLSPATGSAVISSLEEWQKFWPERDRDSQYCPMDLLRRIQANHRQNSQIDLDLRPSAEAAKQYPERGFDPEAGRGGKKYHEVAKTEQYRTWFKHVTREWPTRGRESEKK